MIFMAAKLLAARRSWLLHSCSPADGPGPERRPAPRDRRREADRRRAVGGRRRARDPAERRRERAQGLEAHLEADVGDRRVGVAQELLRALDPAREDVLVRRLPERLLEPAREVR